MWGLGSLGAADGGYNNQQPTNKNQQQQQGVSSGFWTLRSPSRRAQDLSRQNPAAFGGPGSATCADGGTVGGNAGTRAVRFPAPAAACRADHCHSSSAWSWGGGGGLLSFLPVQNSTAPPFSEQIVDIPVCSGGLQGFRPGQGLAASFSSSHSPAGVPLARKPIRTISRFLESISRFEFDFRRCRRRGFSHFSPISKKVRSPAGR